MKFCSFCGDKIDSLNIYYHDKKNNKNYCEICLDTYIAQDKLNVINSNGEKLERSVADE